MHVFKSQSVGDLASGRTRGDTVGEQMWVGTDMKEVKWLVIVYTLHQACILKLIAPSRRVWQLSMFRQGPSQHITKTTRMLKCLVYGTKRKSRQSWISQVWQRIRFDLTQSRPVLSSYNRVEVAPMGIYPVTFDPCHETSTLDVVRHAFLSSLHCESLKKKAYNCLTYWAFLHRDWGSYSYRRWKNCDHVLYVDTCLRDTWKPSNYSRCSIPNFFLYVYFQSNPGELRAILCAMLCTTDFLFWLRFKWSIAAWFTEFCLLKGRLMHNLTNWYP